MKIIIKQRGEGKTQELIELCSLSRYSLIVCHSQKACRDVFELSQEMDRKIPMPITYEELMTNRYAGQNVDTFLFDNVDLFLQSITRVPVEAITMTGKVEITNEDE